MFYGFVFQIYCFIFSDNLKTYNWGRRYVWKYWPIFMPLYKLRYNLPVLVVNLRSSPSQCPEQSPGVWKYSLPRLLPSKRLGQRHLPDPQPWLQIQRQWRPCNRTQKHLNFKGECIHVQGIQLCQNLFAFLVPTLKGKFDVGEVNSYFLECIPFPRKFGTEDNNHISSKDTSIIKLVEIKQEYPTPKGCWWYNKESSFRYETVNILFSRGITNFKGDNASSLTK